MKRGKGLGGGGGGGGWVMEEEGGGGREKKKLVVERKMEAGLNPGGTPLTQKINLKTELNFCV